LSHSFAFLDRGIFGYRLQRLEKHPRAGLALLFMPFIEALLQELEGQSDRQKLVCQFRPDASQVHPQWVAIPPFTWRPPDYLIPQAKRRMLRHNAIEA